MVRLIDADALRETLGITGTADTCHGCKYNKGYYYCNTDKAPQFAYVCECIDDAPTIEAVPVRHGKWIDTETFNRPWFRHHIFKCSVCGNTLDMDGVNAGRGDANYCPDCGAKMDAERN